MTRRSTSTSTFGVSKRESHNPSAFYGRFTAPEISPVTDVSEHRALDKLFVGDARQMDEVPASSVGLVVTSPPYFAGKDYELSLGEQGVPATYLEYLAMLRDVFAECVAKLEPGGRIAVNVANLGRRPYRSLASDVIRILQDDLRLLLRGEIVWVKQRGSSGSCAWGSFQRPGNPVLRDLTERVVIASKGRFDRAFPERARKERGLPSEPSMTREDFMENTLDVWEIPTESATRVGHPAPFPVELPARLIELYTYRGDLVLDPFAGSGSTAVAAVRTGRHFAGYDLDESYIAVAEARVSAEREQVSQRTSPRIQLTAKADASPGRSLQGQAMPLGPAVKGVTLRQAALQQAALQLQQAAQEGQTSRQLGRLLICSAGFEIVEEDARQPGGIDVTFSAIDKAGGTWLFEVAGAFTTFRSGLKRADPLWKTIGKAAVLHQTGTSPFVVLTPELPAPGSPGGEALRAVTGPGLPIVDMIEVLAPNAAKRLRELVAVRPRR